MGNGLPLLHVQALAEKLKRTVSFGGAISDGRGRWAPATSSGIASGIIRTSASVASSTKQLIAAQSSGRYHLKCSHYSTL